MRGLRSRRGLILAGAAVLVAAALVGAYLWLFVIDRVVRPDARPRHLADGTRLEVVGLRWDPVLASGIPSHELRLFEPDGALRFAVPLFDGDARSGSDVMIADDVLVLEGGVFTLAIDRRTGETLWRREGLSDLTYTGSLGPRVFVAGDRTVVALDRDTGETLWEIAHARAGGPVMRFGEHAITAGFAVLDAATGTPRPPLDGFHCRTEHELLTCDERGCRRHRVDGTETVLSSSPVQWARDCYARDGLLVANIDLPVRGGDTRADPGRSISSLSDLDAADHRVLAAWDADDRLVWAWASQSYPGDTCLLTDGRLKLPHGLRADHRPETLYFDLATGTYQRCVGLDMCPGTIAEPWGLDMSVPPGERECGQTEAVERDP